MIFLGFWDGNNVCVKPCTWICVVGQDSVQGVEKSLLCVWSEVSEEKVVDVIGARACFSSTLDC